jgi:hypothetical protein
MRLRAQNDKGKECLLLLPLPDGLQTNDSKTLHTKPH